RSSERGWSLPSDLRAVRSEMGRPGRTRAAAVHPARDARSRVVGVRGEDPSRALQVDAVDGTRERAALLDPADHQGRPVQPQARLVSGAVSDLLARSDP